MKMRTAILLTAITLLALGGCQETPEPEPMADPVTAPAAPAAPAEPEPAPTEPEEPDTDSDESTESSGDTDQ